MIIDSWISDSVRIGLGGRLDFPLQLALREPVVGQRKKGGKNRTKVKAARKQNRRTKK